MAQKNLNYGTTAGDGTGEILFTTFDKCQDNFTELYDRTDIAESTTIIPLTNSDLNTAFPSAPNGFRVVAPLIVGGGGAAIYTKISTGWVSLSINVL